MSVSVQIETKRNLFQNQGRSRKPSHSVVLISTTHLDLSSLTFPRLLFGYLLIGCYTAQNGLSRQFSPLFCLFACFYLQTCVCVCMCLLTGAKESTYRDSLTTSQPQNVSPHMHTPILPPSVSWPSCTACLSQGCTPACLRLPLHLGLSAALEEEHGHIISRHCSGKSSTAYPWHCRYVGHIRYRQINVRCNR